MEIQEKKVFEIGEKYYFTDLGLRHAIQRYNHALDINKIIENMVHNHLVALGYSLKVGRQGTKEIDFVCTKGSNIKYIQVAYLISDEKVAEREFGNLLAIKDNYEKFVISSDDFISGDYSGIKHLHISTFLLDDTF